MHGLHPNPFDTSPQKKLRFAQVSQMGLGNPGEGEQFFQICSTVATPLLVSRLFPISHCFRNIWQVINRVLYYFVVTLFASREMSDCEKRVQLDY